MENELRLAVLIDADNAPRTALREIMAEVAVYGKATIKRIYGDWTAPNMGSWKPLLLEHAITPFQQYSYTTGKNATDSAMIIDAMDILYTGNVEGFCIVSSDSDFTRLASRLREAGKFVIGMGEKKPPAPFVAANHQFKNAKVLADRGGVRLMEEKECTGEGLYRAAMELLAKGCEGELGIGDLVAVDVGGATTDVYSMADGMPEQMNTVYKGLPEPFSKRTVEGDIGMRYSIRGIVEAAGLPRVSQLSGLSQDRVEALVDMLRANTDRLPDGDRELENLDYALASLAVETAVARHAGTMEETYTLMGQTFVQSGKNLTNVRQIVVTGGSLIHAERVAEIARHALYSTAQPASLRPKEADIWVDRTYILAAMGLLAAHEPQTALRIMKKELEKHGYQK